MTFRIVLRNAIGVFAALAGLAVLTPASAQEWPSKPIKIVAPFLVWRALVVASPIRYPTLPGKVRARLLDFIARVMRHDGLDLDDLDALFGPA